MKKPLLIFALKCSVIMYFAACTGINEYGNTISATPRVTKGTWKINLFTDEQTDQTAEFSGYTLKFDPSGKITADKNGVTVTGNWIEDNILKRITINLDTEDAALTKLNDYWNIAKIGKESLSFRGNQNSVNDRLEIISP
ncbi:MAG: hypothetical protein WBP16_13270 [Ferruginibacter sp.]